VIGAVRVAGHQLPQLVAQDHLGDRVLDRAQGLAPLRQPPEDLAHLAHRIVDRLFLPAALLDRLGQLQGALERVRRAQLLVEVGQEAIQPRLVRGVGAVAHRLHQLPALQQLAGQLHAGLVLLAQLLGPGEERVPPGRDRVPVGGVLLERKAAAPAVVDQGLHLGLRPGLVAHFAVAQHDADHVVAVGEDVRLHLQPVAHDPLHREAAPVDLRRDLLDDDGVDLRDHRLTPSASR
jgi:hypothetical protein